MAESCQMYRSGASVGIAVRSQSQPDWISASAHLSGYQKFRRQLLDSYIEARLPVLLAQLKNGRSLSFKMANLSGKLQKAFSTGIHGYVKVDTESVTLTDHALSVKGHAIDVGQIQAIDYSNWTERITFLMSNGDKEMLPFTSLFDGDLLLALIEQLSPALNESRAEQKA
jgi:hypothetical protein